jgi:hypothetical protein
MMGRKTTRNMYSYNTNNKIGPQCVCWFYLQQIYHDARSYSPKIPCVLFDISVAFLLRPLMSEDLLGIR